MNTPDNVNPDLIAKAKACETPEELIALAKEAGYELSDDQLEGVSGGWIETCNDETDEYDVHGPDYCKSHWVRG